MKATIVEASELASDDERLVESAPETHSEHSTSNFGLTVVICAMAAMLTLNLVTFSYQLSYIEQKYARFEANMNTIWLKELDSRTARTFSGATDSRPHHRQQRDVTNAQSNETIDNLQLLPSSSVAAYCLSLKEQCSPAETRGPPGPPGPPGPQGPPGPPGTLSGQLTQNKLNISNQIPGASLRIRVTNESTIISEHNETAAKNRLPNLHACKITRIGIPLYSGKIVGSKYGAYLKDPMPRRKGWNKIWITKGYYGNQLLEYDSQEDLNAGQKASRVYKLPKPFYGTGHVIFQGSLFYHAYNTDTLLRYDLHLKRVLGELKMHLSGNDSNAQHCRVYSDHREHVGCVDFSVDENGLWVVYRNGSRVSIYVSKLDVDSLRIQRTVVIEATDNGLINDRRRHAIVKRQGELFNVSRGLDEVLNAFVVCGRIYFLQYHGSQNAVIKLMFDLYDVDSQFVYLQSIEFIQPYKSNTQLTYNPFDNRLYAWDAEHLITYSLELV